MLIIFVRALSSRTVLHLIVKSPGNPYIPPFPIPLRLLYTSHPVIPVSPRFRPSHPSGFRVRTVLPSPTVSPCLRLLHSPGLVSTQFSALQCPAVSPRLQPLHFITHSVHVFSGSFIPPPAVHFCYSSTILRASCVTGHAFLSKTIFLQLYHFFLNIQNNLTATCCFFHSKDIATTTKSPQIATNPE